MHPQAPNTQTFLPACLPACLLPTACDYNDLDCFDPLEPMARIAPSQPNEAMARIASRKNSTISLGPKSVGF
jgi:hypothetical protein